MNKFRSKPRKKIGPEGEIIIIGAARQGLALARYLSRHGHSVLINDQRKEHDLTPEIESLRDLNVKWLLGTHDPKHLARKPIMICPSGGVPLDNPMVRYAIHENIPLSNDTEIFLSLAPCLTIGITGSAGKTTTTTLVGRMAKTQQGKKWRKVWVGGNIGDPLINYLDEIQTKDLAILEISSFQAEQMRTSPRIGAILNITPNHLDRHGTMENYAGAKANVLANQSERDFAVLNRDDRGSIQFQGKFAGKLFTYGFTRLMDGADGVYAKENDIVIRSGETETVVPIGSVLRLPGRHNFQNAMAASAMAFLAGVPTEGILDGLRDFNGVPHRLELFGEWKGARWINDSIGTAPERSVAAIKAFDGDLVIFLGGRDKKLPWKELATLCHQRVKKVYLFGEAAPLIEEAFTPIPQGSSIKILRAARSLYEAAEVAVNEIEPGETVLFSPGGTSYDEFKDFAERGERFKEWITRLIDNP